MKEKINFLNEIPNFVAIKLYKPLIDHLNTRFSGNKKELIETKIKLLDYFLLTEWRYFEEFLDGKKNQKKIPGRPRTNEKIRHKIERIRQLYLGFDIPYSIFHEKLKEKHILTRYSPGLTDLKEFVDLSHKGETKEKNHQFANRYFSTLKPYIEKAKREILVYAYLGKGGKNSPDENLPYYGEAHINIFNLIEKTISKNSQLKYIRMLALPFPDSVPNENDVRLVDHKRDKAAEAIRDCSIYSFGHICSCLKQYAGQCQFYIVWLPTRIYHYGLIDDYIITEYYKYQTRGDFTPDLLYVTLKRGKLEELHEVYEKELKKLSETKNNRAFIIEEKELVAATEEAYYQLNDEISSTIIKNELTKPNIAPFAINELDAKLDILMSKRKSLMEKMKLLDEWFPNKLSKGILLDISEPNRLFNLSSEEE